MKKILSLILSAIMLVTLSLSLFACDDKENNPPADEKATYTVTVVDEDGNPIKGAMVNFNVKGGAAFPMPTDAEGKASYTTDKQVTVSILSVPDGYEYFEIGKNITLDSNGSATVTVKKAEIIEDYFVILVVDQYGAPVEGVLVQMCTESSCLTPTATDENGEASYSYADGEFKAKLTSIPEGYTVADPEAYYEFENDTATIVLTKLAD